MQNINLLDRRLVPCAPLLGSGTALVAFALALLVVAGHALVESRLTAHALRDAGPEPPPESAPAAAPPGAAQLRVRLAEREALLHALRSETEMPVEPEQMLRAVVAALPETMWLTELELAGARELRIAGGTLDPLALAEFARGLAATSALRGLGLQAVRLEPHVVAESNPDSPAQPPTHRFVLASQAIAAGAPQ